VKTARAELRVERSLIASQNARDAIRFTD